jgi:hypothetical protein
MLPLALKLPLHRPVLPTGLGVFQSLREQKRSTLEVRSVFLPTLVSFASNCAPSG